MMTNIYEGISYEIQKLCKPYKLKLEIINLNGIKLLKCIGSHQVVTKMTRLIDKNNWSKFCLY
jgi:hypothetical protein